MGKIRLSTQALAGSATETVIASSAITTDKIATSAVVNEKVATNAGIVESKLAFSTTAGHHHDGTNSRLIPGIKPNYPSTSDMELKVDRYLFLAGKVSSHLCGNCFWDGTSWQRLDTSYPSSLVLVTRDGNTYIYYTPAGTGTITWSEIARFNTSCQLEMKTSEGTAPFVVSSTTLNTNLNTDLLDGYHGASSGANIYPFTGADGKLSSEVIPPVAGNWIKIAETVLTSNASSVSFEGLDGNTAKVYLLLINGGRPSGGAGSDIGMRFNADSGPNYRFQGIWGTGGSLGAGNADTTYGKIGHSVPNLPFFNYTFIHTTLGAGFGRGWNSFNFYWSAIDIMGGYWENTIDNITQFSIFHTTAVLFKAGTRFTLFKQE